MQYHQGQSTLPRLLALLRSVGVSISKRQLQRLLTDKHEISSPNPRMFCAPGLRHRRLCRADDTGARHAGKNGFCTQIGNDWFTWFGTRSSKSRLNFLDLLRAGHTDYVLNDAAYALHARAASVGGGDRPFDGWTTDAVRRSGRVAGPSRPARLQRAERHAKSSSGRDRGRFGAAFDRTGSCATLSCSVTTRDNSMSAGTRCAGFTRNGWYTSWTPSTISTAPRRAGSRADLGLLRRPQGLPDRNPASAGRLHCAPASTVSSAAAPASPRWTACWRGCTPIRPSC